MSGSAATGEMDNSCFSPLDILILVWHFKCSGWDRLPLKWYYSLNLAGSKQQFSSGACVPPRVQTRGRKGKGKYMWRKRQNRKI